MSGKLIAEIEKRLKNKKKEEDEEVKIDSYLKEVASDFERKLDDARERYSILKDKIPDDIRDEMKSFIRDMVADITR